jgi:hypothetical protein
MRFAELPDWAFSVEEVSVGVYEVTGTDGVGHRVQAKGVDPEVLLAECRRDAAAVRGQPLMTPIENAEIASLVNRYSESAAAHGRATEAGDHKTANAAHEVLATVYRELRRRGVEAQRALLPLLEHNDIGVRGWAGAHALEFAPSEGESALTALAEVPRSLISFSAKMTLRQWREGTLRFP